VLTQADRIRGALSRGLRKGLSSCIWLLKILLPVSLATALLDYSGWIHQLDVVLKPAMAAAILAVYCVDLSFWVRRTFKAS
jgi:hypothetical protein